jgi:hypothetical protein
METSRVYDGTKWNPETVVFFDRKTSYYDEHKVHIQGPYEVGDLG